MSMQEHEQEWQESQGQSAYQGGYGSYEIEQQKIHPYGPQQKQGYVFHILMIVISSLGFVFTVMTLIASAIVLRSADGSQPLIFGGVLGLVSSILAMLTCIAIFVLAIVFLAVAVARRRRAMSQNRARGKSLGSLGNLGW